MPKYYVMLVDQEQNEMYVPAKALLNPYNGNAAFASGMPQFFGGTDDEDQAPATVLDQELAQESRRSLELTGSPLHFFTRGDMFYYWVDSDRWQGTDIPWGSARDASEAEMDRIEAVDLTRFDVQGTNDALIQELIDQTRCGRAPIQGAADFAGSATREAFIELLHLLLG